KLYPREKYPDGHPELARSLNHMGHVPHVLGEYRRALGYYEQALAMQQKLYPRAKYPDGHPDLKGSLNNLGFLLKDMGEDAKGLGYFEQALALDRLRLTRELLTAPEAQAIALILSRPRTRDGYLSSALRVPGSEGASYREVWFSKGPVLQLLQRRHAYAAIARLQSPELNARWQRLHEVRRQVSQWLVNPGRDPDHRDHHLAQLHKEQQELERDLARLLNE